MVEYGLIGRAVISDPRNQPGPPIAPPPITKAQAKEIQAKADQFVPWQSPPPILPEQEAAAQAEIDRDLLKDVGGHFPSPPPAEYAQDDQYDIIIDVIKPNPIGHLRRNGNQYEIYNQFQTCVGYLKPHGATTVSPTQTTQDPDIEMIQPAVHCDGWDVYSTLQGYVGHVNQDGDWHLRTCSLLWLDLDTYHEWYVSEELPKWPASDLSRLNEEDLTTVAELDGAIYAKTHTYTSESHDISVGHAYNHHLQGEAINIYSYHFLLALKAVHEL